MGGASLGKHIWRMMESPTILQKVGSIQTQKFKNASGLESFRTVDAPAEASSPDSPDDERLARQRAYNAAYRKANRERIRQAYTKWHEANKETARTRQASFVAQNPERCRAYYAKYRASNPQKRKETCAAYRAKNSDREKSYRKAYAEKNKDKLAAKSAARRASKIRATPAWADHEKIAKIYAEAKRLTQETGVEHHVDHIFPLKSNWCCGLHVETNLQILEGRKNISKGNRRPELWGTL